MARVTKGSVSFRMSPPTALFGHGTDHTRSSHPVYRHAAKALHCRTTAAARLNQCSAVCLEALWRFKPGLH